MSLYSVAPADLKLLFQAYWAPTGWREPPTLPVGKAWEQALRTGVMFAEAVRRTHDEWVDAVQHAAEAISLDDVSAAFISSLASARLDLRSALGSYVIARQLPAHRFEAQPHERTCAVCGLPSGAKPVDLNILNFERFKWGGVRRDQLDYVAFDLEQFQRAPKETPSPEAIAVGRELLDMLRHTPARDTAARATSSLRMVKGNADQRAVILDILGVCGVLETNDHPGYLSRFIRYDERALPPHHFVERCYPVCWWRGSDGVNLGAVQALLPALL